MNEITVTSLDEKIKEAGLSENGAISIRNAYEPHFTALHEMADQIASITEDQPEKARAARLRLVKIRTGSDKTRKELKEDSLRRGKAIDGIHNLLVYMVSPTEKALEDIEKAEERREKARILALHESRMFQIARYSDASSVGDLGSMSEDQWQMMLAGAKARKEAADAEAARIEAERLAEEKRVAAEAERLRVEQEAERARIKAENERLAAEAAKARAEAEAIRKEAEEAAMKAKAEADAERARLEKIAAEERAQREAAERAAKAEADRLHAEKMLEAEIARKAACAPDKEKLLTFAESLGTMFPPNVSTDAAKRICQKFLHDMAVLSKQIYDMASAL